MWKLKFLFTLSIDQWLAKVDTSCSWMWFTRIYGWNYKCKLNASVGKAINVLQVQ
jgi:hypothetical protein